MPGTYFENPDCLVETPVARNREELLAAAKAVHETGILIITEPEYLSIKKEVGLGYKWQGKRLFVR